MLQFSIFCKLAVHHYLNFRKTRGF